MKRIILTLTTIIIYFSVFSQGLSVDEFKPIVKVEGIIDSRTDLNNRPCALIQVQFPIKGVKFQGNVIGDVPYKEDVYYVYLSPGSTYLQVKSPNSSAFRIDFREYGFKGVGESDIYCLVLSDEGELTAEELYERAMNYDKAGDISNSIKYLKLSSDKGFAAAECMLGVIYYAGYGDISKDYNKAFDLFTKSADKSYEDAIFYKATCFYEGNGVRQDKSQAFLLWKTIANNGHIRAQNSVGNCLITGTGVARNVSEGIAWIRSAAEKGYSDAQFTLGHAYFSGSGVSKDYDEAAKWLKKAADQNNAGSQYALGVLYESGLGLSKDLKKAIEYYQKASDQGIYEAKKALFRLKNN